MIGASWLPYGLMIWLPELLSAGSLSDYVLIGHKWILDRVTLQEILLVCAGLSALSAVLFVFGLTRIRLSERGIQWEVLPWVWRRWRWTSLREIRIDETGRHFEDDDLSKRTIVIRGPGPLGIGSDFLRISNRVWDHYDEAEMAVVAVGVPAIAARLVRRIQKTGKPERFAVDGSTSLLMALTYLVLAVGAIYAALRDDIWIGPLEPWRPVPMALAVALFIMSLTGLLAKSIAVDQRTLYILRRGWVQRRIPLTSIADVDTRDNATRIRVWKDQPGGKTREAWRTDRFIHNRGVLLHLLRELARCGNLPDCGDEWAASGVVAPQPDPSPGRPRRVLSADPPRAVSGQAPENPAPEVPGSVPATAVQE
jgi:hypothetical protein